MYLKVFVNCKVHAIQKQKSEPWKPTGKAGLPLREQMSEPRSESEEWSRERRDERLQNLKRNPESTGEREEPGIVTVSAF